MTQPPCSFIWYELMTSDADAAAAFYGSVVGWSFSGRDPAAPMDYRQITRSDGGGQGGVLQLSAAMQAEGARPAWVPYLHAGNFDLALAAILADGGMQFSPRMDIAEGSFAMVADPFGTPFYLMQPNPPEGQPDAVSDVFSPAKPQHVRWNELHAPDPAGAKAFYTKHFGFTFTESMPMGDLGDYCFFDQGAIRPGAIMQRQDPAQPPLWTLYFGVPDIHAAAAAITAGGGTILFGPHIIPGGEYNIIARDPQGAQFGLVGPGAD